MKFVRYETHGETSYGVIEDEAIRQITAPPFEKYEITDHSYSLSEIRLLSPVLPGKIIAIGLNYASHLGDREPPSVPEPFLKTPSAVIGPGESIIIPNRAIKESVTVQPEAELAVVIGTRCKGATQDNALKHVLGYTCGNDISARQWQANDLSWWRAKSSDTFAPLGPVIETNLDPSNLRLIGRVNGKIVQDQVTSDLLYDIPTIIEFVSSVMTLDPGDVIMTGTPGKPGDIHSGDTVEVEIEGIGVLKNPVKAD